MRPLFIPLLIVAFLASFTLFLLVPRKSGGEAKLIEISALLSSVPVYPNAREVDSYSSDKPLHVSVGKFYVSPVNYDELKRYYLDQLSTAKWRLIGEEPAKDWWRDLGGRKLTFQQGDYILVIQFAGEKADYAWSYSISITS